MVPAWRGETSPLGSGQDEGIAVTRTALSNASRFGRLDIFSKSPRFVSVRIPSSQHPRRNRPQAQHFRIVAASFCIFIASLCHAGEVLRSSQTVVALASDAALRQLRASMRSGVKEPLRWWAAEHRSLISHRLCPFDIAVIVSLNLTVRPAPYPDVEQGE